MTSIATSPPAAAKPPVKETLFESIASFVQFFIVLLITTRFFLPLFQIPTGSMAETLYGAHGTNTCPNCGMEYPVNCDGGINSMTITIPPVVQCPNCWFGQYTTAAPNPGPQPALLNPAHGDRIVIHGWIYDLPWNIAGLTAPRRWDVVVFKYPPEPANNFIKRLIGLPNESVEIVDGDIFINGAISRKPEYAQRPLWIPVFENDYRPNKPGVQDYWPRWVANGGQSPWTGLDSRVFRYEGDVASELLFVTDPKSPTEPGAVVDKNGYNGPLITDPRYHVAPYHIVSDVRVSAAVQIDGGSGHVDFELTKYDTAFRLRFGADGSWAVLKHTGNSGEWTECKRGTSARALGRNVPVALGIADYQVVAEVNGARVYASDDDKYSISLEQARERAVHPARPRIAISAEHVTVRLSKIVIDRDVFYTNDVAPPGHEFHAGLGQPFQLDGDDYFVLGDNSRASSDARVWTGVGPHLLDAAAAGEHRPGTIPRDQLLGRAFFVYWPGVRSFAGKLPVLPNFGDIRWIR